MTSNDNLLDFVTQHNIPTVDVTKPENRPLLLVTEEIRAFSCGTRTVAYKKYPIAATILFRSLVEQCFKYLLRETYPKLYASLQARSNGDPTLRILVDTINQQKILFSQQNQLQNVSTPLYVMEEIKTAFKIFSILLLTTLDTTYTP